MLSAMTPLASSSLPVTACSFRAMPLEGDFPARVRATLHDCFDRPVRVTVAKGGEPVRDRLCRARAGEPIILCSYAAVPLPSAYAEIGPVFLSAEDVEAREWTDELPPGYFIAPFALRAYNASDEIIASAVVEPATAPEQIRRWLARPETAYLHARFLGHGCFACRFERVGRD